MKKTNKSAVLLLVLLVLVAVSAMYVASTYAKYTAEITGKQGTATVAKWDFANENSGVTLTIALDPTVDASTLVGDRIAPGTSGSFDLVLTNKNSETGVDFGVALGTPTNAPTNLKFYSDSSYTHELTVGATDGAGTITGQIAAGDATGATVKIYWKWAYETPGADTTDVTAGDAADTADGITAKSITIPVTITGVQTPPSGTAISTRVNP